MKKIKINSSLCVGCGRCEVFCTANHSASRDIYKAYTLEGLRGTNRIHLLEGNDGYAVQCRQCKHTPCVFACISGSMHVDPSSGAVINDTKKCVGCWSCIAACPNGCVFPYHEKDGTKYALKCDLCLSADGEPACVKACPNGALTLVEV
ncbi:MAG: 4Fe-4S binding protein [Eubacteriales bacterium]|nr:4Fe-4S binding protein [Eubacteriales bacterium]MDD3881979.1 4Fe-4S binding protein [Eubacteriales bacterium]MDD4513120.1 4Fe-4S binding protein [Eubacteriales bacterium]